MTCGCRSPTAATSAASTACPPTACLGSSAPRSSASRRSSGWCELFAAMGVEDVRLTGGEPLVRREFPKLVAMLREIERLEDLALTTNGYLLERDADGPGRRRASTASTSRSTRWLATRFFQITRRDALAAGAARASRRSRPSPRSGRSRSTRSRCATSPRTRCCASASFARTSDYQVRFIEFMPLDADRAWTPDAVLTGARDQGDDRGATHRLEELPREPPATARVYRFADGERRDRLHQPGLRALLRRLQPHPPDRRRQAPHLPLLDPRDRPARARCAPARATPSSGRSSATPSGARSSSTTSTRPGFRPPPRTMSAIGG